MDPRAADTVGRLTVAPVRGAAREKIAADGLVEEGTSAVDASLLTGEPCPSRSPG